MKLQTVAPRQSYASSHHLVAGCHMLIVIEKCLLQNWDGNNLAHLDHANGCKVPVPFLHHDSAKRKMTIPASA